jgi:hypothetical protein
MGGVVQADTVDAVNRKNCIASRNGNDGGRQWKNELHGSSFDGFTIMPLQEYACCDAGRRSDLNLGKRQQSNSPDVGIPAPH